MLLFFMQQLAGQITDTTRISMSRLNDLYQLQARHVFSIAAGPWHGELRNTHFQRYYLLAGTESRSKGEHRADAFLRRQTGQWESGAEWSIFSLRDRLSGIVNDYSKSSLGLSVASGRRGGLQLAAGVGSEERQGRAEKGLYSRMHYSPAGEDMEGTHLDLEQANYDRRKNRHYDLQFSRRSFLGDLGRNRFSAGFKQIRREYYTDAALTREKRTNIHRGVENDAVFRFPAGWSFGHSLRYSSEDETLGIYALETRGRRRKEHYIFDNRVELGKALGPFQLTSAFGLQQEQNSYSSSLDRYVSPADYNAVKKDIEYSLKTPFSPGDSLQMGWRVSLYQFTTPDSENVDDRDELSHILTLAIQRSPGEILRLSVKGQIFYRHLMYLSSRRSAQNHVNRIYSLETGQSLYLTPRWILQSRQRIFANYYVYDYEKLYSISYRSMIYRGIHLYQHLMYRLSDRHSFSAGLEWKNEEDGFLDWDAFLQQTTVDRKYYRGRFSYSYQRADFRFDLGPYLHYRIDSQVSGTDRERILDPLRFGLSGGLSLGRALVFEYTLEDLRQNGEHERYQQQGRLLVNLIF